MSTDFPSHDRVEAERRWLLIDAQGQVVGRLASRIAALLRGKAKPRFVPYADCGDYVIVINAEKVRFTGQKLENKVYYQHTGYIGSVRTDKAKDLLEKKPEQIIINAVQGMLPKTTLGKAQIKNLKVYRGNNHPHHAQKAEPVKL